MPLPSTENRVSLTTKDQAIDIFATLGDSLDPRILGSGTALLPQISEPQSQDQRDVMRVCHQKLPTEGLQFHAELILTTADHTIIEKFLEGRDR